MKSTLPVTQQAIDLLRAAARAPSTNWETFIRQADQLPIAPISDAGAAAALLTMQVKPIMRQTVQVVPEAEEPMRRLLLALADALQVEFGARFQPAWHNRD